MEFADKTFVVTGAAGNLGRAVAKYFAERGARLALLDHDQARLLQAYGPDHANRACLQPTAPACRSTCSTRPRSTRRSRLRRRSSAASTA